MQTNKSVVSDFWLQLGKHWLFKALKSVIVQTNKSLVSDFWLQLGKHWILMATKYGNYANKQVCCL
jgi:hypothetical protein